MLTFNKNLRIPFGVHTGDTVEEGKYLINYFKSKGALNCSGLSGMSLETDRYIYVSGIDNNIKICSRHQLSAAYTLYGFNQFKHIIDSSEKNPKLPSLGLASSYAVKVPNEEAGKKLIRFLKEIGVATGGLQGNCTEWFYVVNNNKLDLIVPNSLNPNVLVTYMWETMNHIIDHYNSAKKDTSCKCNGNCQCNKKENLSDTQWLIDEQQEIENVSNLGASPNDPALIIQESSKTEALLEEIKEILKNQTNIIYVPQQACPRCNGEGKLWDMSGGLSYIHGTGGVSTMNVSTCPVCNGKGIIPMHKIN
jgi:hypothetical protein